MPHQNLKSIALRSALAGAALPVLLNLACSRHHLMRPDEVVAAAIPKVSATGSADWKMSDWKWTTSNTDGGLNSPPGHTQCYKDEQMFQNRTDLTSDNDTQKVSLQRVYQHVTRQDCAGQVTSSKIEVVDIPTLDFKFKPHTPLPSAAGAVWLFNSMACDWTYANFRLDQGFISRWVDKKITRSFDGPIGNSKGELQLTIDQGKGGATFHMNPGLNKIYYTYYDKCVPENYQTRSSFLVGECREDSTKEVKSGFFMIDVDYKEITLPGDVVKREEECAKPNP